MGTPKIIINGQDYTFTESFVFGVDNLVKLRTLLTQAIDYSGLTGTVQVYSSPVTSGASGAAFTIHIENTTVETLVLEMTPSIAFGNVCKHEFMKNKKNCCIVDMPIGPGSMGVNNPFTTSNYDLFTEKVRYDHWTIDRIDYGADCVSGAMRNEFKYDKNHRVTARARCAVNQSAGPSLSLERGF